MKASRTAAGRQATGASIVMTIVLALLAGAPTAAHGADVVLDPTLQITDAPLVFTPASRTGDFFASKTSALVLGPDVISNELANCPVGYRSSSRSLVIAPDGTVSSAAEWVRTPPGNYYGLNETAGEYIYLDGMAAVRWNEVTFQTGLNRFIVTCDPALRTMTDSFADSKYFLVTLDVNVAAKSWTVVANPVNEAKLTPSIAFTKTTANADGSVTLTSTVSAGAGVATDATGVVSISGNYSGLATPVSGEAAVSAGVATWRTPVLDADRTYTFTAGYTAKGDTKYTDSAVNATTTVTTVAGPTPPQNTAITVTIPASATGLKFTMTPGAVALNQAALDGTSYVATGSLGQVTVSDNRRARTAWTLSGNSTNFVNTADATQTIAATSLGWKPALVGATNAGTAGIEVIAGASGGLSASTPLAQAAAGVSTADTTINAGITLKAPADSAAGVYSATLTLTLI
ncbi:hypothetical protein [Cryobacterium luteum]|uniref:WxL domain surface cell wall-binding n=1 Tax=Cryobacterium luteum TaxID=1424661 RepID=A0A1H8CC18_9MICO|nr:hypothetical protein [Cryobacterium luteum]TFB89324.1 hypothetical protein E3O10_10690 [Cryobacterium luteum]SEM92560.1 hypothetical protein SAMN05216281_102333 [Cryobacterium luteum]